ncbi:drug/metabolite transporter, DME family [Streptomyces zhaozhouensis]|uniref:Drug/metabolite transporter, DME family n=1 Tax=Streptomyces zhaozhouensis TaxID=1300267 RepID=A0A286DWJ2_9ACTN|nr:EamA family transporter [Streptomyces zhaozhouensis]SOD63032.1 drug/metabolite transporter, DME family [Streptomyces zhaozhouensis]
MSRTVAPTPAPTTPRPPRRGFALLAFAGLAWGTTGAAAELLYRTGDMGPLALSFWRFLAGAALLLPAWALTRTRRRPVHTPAPARRRAPLLLGTGLGLAVFQSAYFVSVQATGLAVSTVVTLGAAPVLTAAAGRLFLGERVGRGGLWALAGALTGLAVLVLGNEPGVVRPAGVAASLLSATGYTLSHVLGRRTGRHGTGEDPLALTLWSFLVGAAALLLPAWAEGPVPHGDHRAEAALVLLYLATVTTAVAYPLYFAGVAAVPAATAAVMMLLEPVSAAVLAVALLGERLTSATVAGTAILLTSITTLAAASRPRRRD